MTWCSPVAGRWFRWAIPPPLPQATLDLLALPPSERADMGRTGRAYMIAEYERDACVHEWLHIYGALLGNKGLTLPARIEADDPARTRSKAAIAA